MIVEIEQDRTPDLLYTQEVLRALQVRDGGSYVAPDASSSQQLRAQSMRSRRRTRRQQHRRADQRMFRCHVYVFLAVALSIGLVAAIIKLAASRLN
eukprot:755545-Hanusia_phi.AAC.5